MTTFADLGIPFPLFEAPTSEASGAVGLSSCLLCEGRHPALLRCLGGVIAIRMAPVRGNKRRENFRNSLFARRCGLPLLWCTGKRKADRRLARRTPKSPRP